MAKERVAVGRTKDRSASGSHTSGASLRAVLIFAFVVQAVLAAGWVGYVSLRDGRRAVNDVAQKLGTEISARIVQHLEAFLKTPHQIIELNANEMRAGLVPATDASTLARGFWEQVKAFESVSSIYFGNASGGLVDAGREGAKGRLYIIETDHFSQGEFRKYSTDDRGNKAELLQTVPEFDARTRGWYLRAVDQGGAVWSSIYGLFSGQGMAIAASRPVYSAEGELLGVMSSDIFLSQIGDFLRSVEIGKTGKGFILERSGLLVASSTEEEPFAVDGASLRRLSGAESSVPSVRAASEHLAERFGSSEIPNQFQSEFRMGGERQFVQVAAVVDGYGIDWRVVLVIPEADFLSGIRASSRGTLLWIAVATLVAVLFGLVTAERVTQPVQRLDAAARALADGEWDPVPHVGWIREIHGLAHSFNAMSEKLQRTWTDLRSEVTERQEAEEEVRESEARYRLLADNVSDVIWTADLEGRFTYVSPSIERLRGYTPEEVMRVPMSAALTPDSLRVVSSLMEGLSERSVGGEPSAMEERVELEQPCKDGSTVWTESVVTLLRDPEGGPSGFLGISRDITARKRAEQETKAMEAQLRQSQKLESIGTLASGIAHEINNPLTGIINYADLIERRIEEGQLKEFAAGIMHEGNRVAEIVRSLLAFARQETPARSLTRIRTILDASLMLIGAVLRRDQIRVEVDVAEGLPLILCRSMQIQQVVLNLLTNARDALNRRYQGFDENKVIRITARRLEERPGDWVRITVEDQGTGVPEELLERVFDPFFTTKPRDQGTGLGLSVSYGIIKEHKGELSVESEFGAFTRFHVDLRADEG